MQLAKHRGSDTINSMDISYAMSILIINHKNIVKNYDIVDSSKTVDFFNKLKSNEAKQFSTPDHKKRVELTREECKNIN